MTTQCTLCGADGHAAKDCPWRGAGCNGNCNQGRQCTCAAEDRETSQGVMLVAAVWAVVLLVLWWAKS